MGDNAENDGLDNFVQAAVELDHQNALGVLDGVLLERLRSFPRDAEVLLTRGTTCAVIGAPGSGKSTVIQELFRNAVADSPYVKFV